MDAPEKMWWGSTPENHDSHVHHFKMLLCGRGCYGPLKNKKVERLYFSIHLKAYCIVSIDVKFVSSALKQPMGSYDFFEVNY